MNYAESQLRELLLEADVDVLVAASLAESLKGTAYKNSANTGEEVLIEGVAAPTHWEQIQKDFSNIPTHVAQMDVQVNDSGFYEYRLTANDSRLEDHETAKMVGFLRERWNVCIPYTSTHQED